MRFSVGNVKVPIVVQALYRYFAHPMGAVAHVANVRSKILKSPPPVPSTCIYSMTDGVVPPDSRSSTLARASTKHLGTGQPHRPRLQRSGDVDTRRPACTA